MAVRKIRCWIEYGRGMGEMAGCLVLWMMGHLLVLSWTLGLILRCMGVPAIPGTATDELVTYGGAEDSMSETLSVVIGHDSCLCTPH